MEWQETSLNRKKGKKKVRILNKIEKIYPNDFYDFYDYKINVFVDYRRIETPKGTKCLLNLYSLGLMDSNGEKVLEGYCCTKDACISMLLSRIGSNKIEEIKEFVNEISDELDFYYEKKINNL